MKKDIIIVLLIAGFLLASILTIVRIVKTFSNNARSTTDTSSVPLNTSERTLGETSYLVCKTVPDSSIIYETTFPYPPFNGPAYDYQGNLLRVVPEIKDCIRTTQEYFESKVHPQ